jgi:hypothetical protein
MWRRNRRSQPAQGNNIVGGLVGRRETRGSIKAAARVLEEATAVIEGTTRNSIPAGWQPAQWVWINALAHSSWDQLIQLAERPARQGGGSWEGATSFLAWEVRAYAATAAGLLKLQRNGLIPLELDVLAGRRPAPDSPLELVATVRAEIDRLRQCDQRPRRETS